MMSFDVFISYSSKDKVSADAACAALESAGIRCWVAPRDIIPGDEYGDALIEALDNCRVLVLIFSSNANASRHIRREVERAVSRGVPVVPLRIEDVPPTKAMAYFVGSVHWLDALSPPLEAHFRRLATTVRGLLQVQSDRTPDGMQAREATPDADGATKVANPPRARPRAQAGVLAGLAVLLIAVVGWGAWFGLFSQPRSPGSDATQTATAVDADKTAWRVAEAQNGIAAWNDYLAAWPQGRNAAKAREKIAERKQNRQIGTLPGNATGVSWVAFAPNGSAVMTNASWSNHYAEFALYEMPSGTPLRTYGGAPGVRGAPFSPDGKLLVAYGKSTELHWWKVDDPTTSWSHHIEGSFDWVNNLVFAPDGQTYAVACSDGTVRLRDVAADRELAQFTGDEKRVWGVVFSPDGRWLLSGGDDGKPRLWDVQARQQHLVLGLHKGAAASLAFSGDSRIAYTGGAEESVIRVWEVTSGKLIREIMPHTGFLSGLIVSSDGRFLISWWRDGVIEITDLASDTGVLTLRGPIRELWNVAIAPDGRTLASGGKDEFVRLWDISDLAVKARAAEDSKAPARL